MKGIEKVLWSVLHFFSERGFSRAFGEGEEWTFTSFSVFAPIRRKT